MAVNDIERRTEDRGPGTKIKTNDIELKYHKTLYKTRKLWSC